MGRELSRKIYKAKRDLRSWCDDCGEIIRKGEEYTIHNHMYCNRWVKHWKCKVPKKVAKSVGEEK